MDPVTHALAGQLIADALPFSRRLGEKAPLVAALAAMAPDLDLAPAFLAKLPPIGFPQGFFDIFDSGLARRLHRGYTHSFFCVTLASPLLGWLAWRWSGRRGHWLHWTVIIVLALYSHIVLDMVNPYGVKAWLPFSGTMAALSLLPLVDPPLIAILAAAFIFNHVLRDSYRDPEAPEEERGRWRKRLASFADRLAGPVPAACLGLALAAGRLAAAAWLGLTPFS